MDKADITIIGAGAVGLACAAELAGEKTRLYILEKNAFFGAGGSSRNSEVIHAGIYYPAGSQKASLCVEGNRLLYEIAARNGLPHRQTGKLIVAANAEEADRLEALCAQGRKNGADGLEMLSARQLNALEPAVHAAAALWSPRTGILSAHALMEYYLTRAEADGARLVCRTEVTGAEKEEGGWRLFTRNDHGRTFDFISALVVNCAGLSSDTVAGWAGGRYRLRYCKGDYCVVSGVKPGLVSRLIYPAPRSSAAGLGVHLTIDLAGRMKLGPDATYIDRREDYRVAPSKAALFHGQARSFLPFLKPENVHPDMAGIRPKLQGPDDAFADFVIREDAPGFLNLVGIESPGLTASPAIGRFVRKLLAG
ncbi:MAG: NAD(P)/FAD-dependent oxidoreductase [Smithellaceae bacterium]|nr:NAD(P)/FAD-dependent oxidoreductase [Syntrophaceae bacterium]MDD4242483.1 NAD(P)/FAD-dependent oxidoreductase [Smithellaceae bacterium]NLX53099.1 NAD(P)/FAD-dependent oxidoreductase [Deltaproteobacteria bacterium]